MTSPIQSATAAVPTVLSNAVVPTPAASDSARLLPEPAAVPELDALGEMYALMAHNRRLGVRQAANDIEGNKVKQEAVRYQARKALAAALEEQKDAGMFGELGGKLGTVGKVAAVVGAVALVVGTGGAAAPVVVLAIAGATLSTAAVVQSETRFLQKCGVDDKTAFWLELGFAGGGAICSGGAGALAACGTAANAAQTATSLQKGAQMVGAGAALVGGAAGTASAYAGLRAGLCNADAEEHLADAAKERAAEERLERMVKHLLAALTDSEKSDERALGHLRGAIEAKSSALVLASARV
jgi:hypothetical protein